ncbi:hypothetical protein ABPG72_016190 [Tetrahymena utriculariae]
MFGTQKNIFTKKKKSVQYFVNFSNSKVDEYYLDTLLNEIKPFHQKIEITFQECKFKSEAIKKFGDILMSLKNINYLQLIIKKYVLEGLEDIQELALVLEKLQIQDMNLVLQQSYLRQQGFTMLLQIFSSNQFLKDLSLDLSVNSLGTVGCSLICQEIKNFENVETLSLNLGSNTIKQSGAIDLGRVLAKLKSLRILNLNVSCNSIGQDGSRLMLNEILKNNTLQSLNLSLQQNFLYDMGAKQIGVEFIISKLQKVQIELMNNDLSHDGVNKLLIQLNFSNDLFYVSLNLCDNLIKNNSINQIFKQLSQLKRIKFLELFFNVERNTDAQQFSEFGRALKQCQYLIALKITFCDLKFSWNPKENNFILRNLRKAKRMICCYAYS